MQNNLYMKILSYMHYQERERERRSTHNDDSLRRIEKRGTLTETLIWEQKKRQQKRKNREASKIRVPKRRTKPIALSLCYSYPYLPENTEAEEEEKRSKRNEN